MRFLAIVFVLLSFDEAAALHDRSSPASSVGGPKTPVFVAMFDAWAGFSRAQIYRGQDVFNNPNRGNGRRCNACHSSTNNGTNANDLLFDIGTASAEARTPDLPLYTIRNRATGEERQLTDTARGNVTGQWNDLGRFKTPTLRALAARAPYFHNGIATTFEDVVHHYERHLGFVFTEQERADLVAFLHAL